MNRRIALVVLVAAVLATGCAEATSGPGTDDLPDVVTASRHVPRSISVVRTTGGRDWRARVLVDDDHRYQAELATGEAPVLAEIVIDDDRWVHALQPDLLALVAPGVTIDAAVSTGWARDEAGPQPDLPVPGMPVRALDPSLLEPDVRLLERLPARLRGVVRWNPDAASYLEVDDRFPPHSEDGTRFDVPTVPYDAETFFTRGVPRDLAGELERHFLHLSVWVRDGRVRRVEELFEPPASIPGDLARAVERSGAGGAAMQPAVPRPYRRTARFDYPATVDVAPPPGDPPTVRLPLLPGAVT